MVKHGKLSESVFYIKTILRTHYKLSHEVFDTDEFRIAVTTRK